MLVSSGLATGETPPLVSVIRQSGSLPQSCTFPTFDGVCPVDPSVARFHLGGAKKPGVQRSFMGEDPDAPSRQITRRWAGRVVQRYRAGEAAGLASGVAGGGNQEDHAPPAGADLSSRVSAIWHGVKRSPWSSACRRLHPDSRSLASKSRISRRIVRFRERVWRGAEKRLAPVAD